MTRLGCLLLLFCSYSAFAQFPISPNKLDENGKRTGFWTILIDSAFQKEVTNPDSARYYRLVRYENGKPVGKVRDFYRTRQKQWEGNLLSMLPDVADGGATAYHENGKVKYRMNYKAGKANGLYQEYSINGNLLSEGMMKNDSAVGKWNSYEENGFRWAEVQFINTQKNIATEFYPSGKVKSITPRIMGERHGVVKSFYESGVLQSICEYINGKKHGKWEWYNTAGVVEETGQYFQDNKIGHWKVWHDGAQTLMQEGDYDSAGRVTGKWTYYHVNGKVKSEGQMLNGGNEGLWKFHFDNGVIDTEAWLHKGYYQGERKQYYSTGQLKDVAMMQNDTIHGYFIGYYPNGNKQAEGKKIKDKKDSVWLYYFEDGKLDGLETLRLGQAHGRVVNYYPSGKVKDESYYTFGSRDSLYTSFFDNGQLESTGHYRAGKKEGYWSWYYRNGQLDHTYFYKNGLAEGPFISFLSSGSPRVKSSWKANEMNGPVIRWHNNGAKDEEGEYIMGKATGQWKAFDSLTGKVINRWGYRNGKYHGKAKVYSSDGKLKEVNYYINGIKETPYVIRDSIYSLVKAKRLDEAFAAVEWLKRVLKRDFPANHPANYLPEYTTGYIYYVGMFDNAKALVHIDNALTSFKKTNSLYSDNYYVVLNEKSNVLTGLSRTEEQLIIQDTLLNYAYRKGDWATLNVYLYNRAGVLWNANRIDEIDPMFEKEETRQKAFGPLSTGAINARMNHAAFYSDWAGARDKGIALYQQIFDDLRQENKTDERLIGIARLISYSNNFMSNRPATIHWLKTAINLSEQIQKDNEVEYFENLDLLSNNYINLDYLDSAEWALDKMRKGIEDHEWKNSKLYVRYLDGIAEVKYKRYQYNESINLWTEALQRLEQLGESRSALYGNVLGALGLTYHELDNFKEAEKNYLASMELSKFHDGSESKGYVQTMHIMASIYEKNSAFEKAEELYQQVLRITTDTPPQRHLLNYIEALNGLADLRRNFGKYNEALAYNKKALDALEPHKNIEPPTYLDIISDMALDFRRLNQFDEAEKYTKWAIDEVEKFYGKESVVYNDYQTILANYYNYRGIYSEAVSIYKRVIAGMEKFYGKKNVRYTHAVRNLASSYKDQSEYALARQYYKDYQQQSLELLGALSYDYLDATSELADLSWSLNDEAAAERYYKESIRIAASLYGTTHPSYAYYLKELAGFYFAYGRGIEAEDMIVQAKEIIGQSSYGKESKVYSKYLLLYGQILSGRNKNKEAEEVLNAALVINEPNKKEFYSDYINCANSLADFYEKLGQFNRAEKIHKDIIALTEEVNGKDYTYAVRNSQLIALYYSQGKYNEAVALGQEMLTFFESELSRDHYIILEIRNVIGLALLELRQFEEAAAQFQYCIEMLELTKKTKSSSYATYVNNLSITTLAKGDFANTEKLLQLAETTRKELGVQLDPVSYAVITDNSAALYQAWGKLEKAEPYWLSVTNALLKYTQENFYFMSDEEKTLFWNNIKKDFEYFNSYAVLRAKQNPAILGAMYNNQLATKAILLSASNKIKKRILTSGDTAMINHYYDWTETREKLAQWYTSSGAKQQQSKMIIDSLEMAAKTVEKELNITAEDLDQDKGGQNKWITWRDVQKTLANDEAAVEIIRYRHFDRYLRDSVIYAALILTTETRSTPHLVIFPNGNFLEGRAIRYYKNAITAKLEDKLSYQNFWAPLNASLQGKKRVYLSLDGVFNQINLNTLANDKGQFLVEEKNLTVVSNTKDLLFLKSRRAKRSLQTNAALFGYPKYFIGKDRIKEKLGRQRELNLDELDDRDESGIAELPGTEKEIEEVQAILASKEWITENFMYDNATEKALKSVNYPRVLHIATHGFFIDELETSSGLKLGAATEYARQNPLLRSGLLLSGAANFIQNDFRLDEENGILTAYEAANLNLDNTDLVVLSACETGKGEVQNGEGVYGLQRAFQTAGAQAIIMSLWKVDDAATQELMTSFYQNWVTGKTKAEAFRLAQLQLKSKYNHPYYWGAFVMMGD